MGRAWIALGGNLGDRESIFAEALAAFDSLDQVTVKRGSPVYETPPMGPPGQARYWNAVVEVDAAMEPEELLHSCLAIEKRLGRTREVRWGPRTIDLDLIHVRGVECDTPGLTLPHPRMTERAFVLRPLSDLIQDEPIGSRTVGEWLSGVSQEGMVRVKESVLACR